MEFVIIIGLGRRQIELVLGADGFRVENEKYYSRSYGVGIGFLEA